MMPWRPINTITQHPNETDHSYNDRAAKHINQARRHRTDSTPLKRVKRDGIWTIERLET